MLSLVLLYKQQSFHFPLLTVWLTLVHRAAAEIKTPQLKSFTACPVKDFCSVPSLQPGGGDVEELERCAHDPQRACA